MQTPQNLLSAANENAPGETEISSALDALVCLLARAEARRQIAANTNKAPTGAARN